MSSRPTHRDSGDGGTSQINVEQNPQQGMCHCSLVILHFTKTTTRSNGEPQSAQEPLSNVITGMRKNAITLTAGFDPKASFPKSEYGSCLVQPFGIVGPYGITLVDPHDSCSLGAHDELGRRKG
jgi:hypothetical protein